MGKVVYILTQPPDELVRTVIARQRDADPENVLVIDLTAGEPDYRAVLEQVFEANSVVVW